MKMEAVRFSETFVPICHEDKPLYLHLREDVKLLRATELHQTEIRSYWKSYYHSLWILSVFLEVLLVPDTKSGE
jgi:hypothetical protein